MANLHKSVKKVFRKTSFTQNLADATLGKEKAEEIYDTAHPMGTQMVEQQQVQEDLKKQITEQSQPERVMPLADDAALQAAKRREASRRRRGRASTILGGSSETLG